MLQKLLFSKGLDSDTSPELFQVGFGRERLNVRVITSINGENQSAENVLGNEEVIFALPAGTNKVIGAKEYLIAKKVYYFVYNSNNRHLILEYDQTTGIVSKVFEDSVNILGNATNLLKFNATDLISSVDIVRLDADTDLLYWVYAQSEPYKLNIRKAKLFMSGDYINGYETPFDPRILYRIKQPPLCAPTNKWINTNNKGGDSFQPEILISADNVGFTSGQSLGISSQILFKREVKDDKGEYNPSTSVVSINTAGKRNIDVSLTVRDGQIYDVTTSNGGTPTKPSLTGTLYMVRNNSFVSQVSAVFQYQYTLIDNLFNDVHRFYGGTCQLNFSASNVDLFIGDQISFLFVRSGSVPGTPVISTTNPTLRILKQQVFSSTTSNTNYLFKKLFQFKYQFVYDDYERSAFSPVSKYAFPVTISNGEDIAIQDNVIEIKVDTGSSIVKKIRIVGKEVNSTQYYLVAEIDKDYLKIQDNSVYYYLFSNEVNLEPIEVNESIKLYDNVPQLSGAQSVIPGNRIVDGDIIEGYDPVDVDIKISIFASYITNYFTTSNYKFPQYSFLKTGGIYDFGIVYYDHSNRSGATNLNNFDSKSFLNGKYGTRLYVPFVNSPDYLPSLGNIDKTVYVANPLIEIFHTPPQWATHYQIVMSKNRATNRYLQWITYKITYINVEDGTTVPEATATGIKIELNIVNGYNKVNPGSNLVYSYVNGDKIRFINNRNDSPFSFNDQEILSYDPTGDYIIVRKNSNTPSLVGGDLFEIYNPDFVDDKFMYEIGDCYPIINRDGNIAHGGLQANQVVIKTGGYGVAGTTISIGTNEVFSFAVGSTLKFNGDDGYSVFFILNSKQTLNGVTLVSGTITNTVSQKVNSNIFTGKIISPAKCSIEQGDCFRTTKRTKYYNSLTAAVDNVTHWVESDEASLFFSSKAHTFGRPNVIDLAARKIRRPSTIFYSQPFIPETFINGLSSVFDTNFETYKDTFGNIKRLISDEQSLYMFQELKLSQIPVQQVLFNDTAGNNVVGASPTILSQQPIYYKGDVGLSHAESLAIYNNAKYGIDSKRGLVWRLSNDGLTTISEYLMHTYFTKLFKDVYSHNAYVPILGVFDIRFNEYIMSIYPFGDNVGKTIAFNEKENMWTTEYSYIPEMMVSNGVDIITFKQGKLWKHNSGSLYNNFYGVQYDSMLKTYCNVEPSKVKVYLAVSLEGKNTWDFVMETPVSEECPNGQHTELVVGNFQMKEGFWYSDIFRDDYTPNTVVSPGVPYLPNARFEGRQMRGPYAMVKFTHTGSGYTKLFAANIQVISSERSNI